MLNKILDGENPEIRHYFVPPSGVVVRQSTDIIAVPSGNEKLINALSFIRNNFQDPDLDINQVADAVAMSRRSLFLAFESDVGRTPHSELMRLRLNEAQRLLNETKLTTQEVADRSGFRSLRNFYDAFKRELQTTPAKFRQG